jgi:hypothetical protein
MSKNKIDIKEIKSEKRLFHNIWLDVYPTKVRFEKIYFWPRNYRTVLHFDILEAQKNKSVSKLSLEEITDFLVGRPELKLEDLANSIEKNGVKVPLIILSNGLLLDGNRRYFACSYLFHKPKREGEDLSKILNYIPVHIIKEEDADERVQQKILAESNFVNDYKVPWSLDVKAKVIDDFYHSCIRDRVSKEETYKEIKDVYGEDKTTVDAYIETMELTREFLSSAPEGKRNKFRENVQDKFLYFWEFRNKALRGRGALEPEKELPKVKKLFFKMIKTERFKNYKQVEPMIRAARDPYAWDLLISSVGSKIDMVEALMKEQKAVRSTEDKVRNFLGWLQTKADPSSFTKATFGLLKKVIDECSKLISKKRI